MDLLPDERLVYFGDSAHCPYGPRDLREVRRFTARTVAWLAGQGAKLVVVACNTATAAALDPADPLAFDPLAFDPLDFDLPVIGVIAPAVEAAARATRNGRVGVIGTVGTVSSRAYDHAMGRLAPDVKVFSQACPGFVELVEAGRTTDPQVLAVAAHYLTPLRAADVDTLILACTHYPLLTGVLSHVMGPEVVLVSSAEATARRVFSALVDGRMLAHAAAVEHRFVTSGEPSAFARLATRFLGPRLPAVDVARPA